MYCDSETGRIYLVGPARWKMEDLPVLHQHFLPDDLPDDLVADAKQHGEWGVAIVEAVQ